MASPWRVHRARSVVLAAIGIILAGTLAAYLARRRSRPQAPPQPTPMAEDVGQQTQSFSLSKTLGEHTLYTIQAEQVTNYEATGKALLHNVSVLIYGKDGSRRDRITSAECYYDPVAASIWIPGDVEMQFDLPAPESNASGGDGPAPIPLSIFTSKLSFEQNTGIAATDAPVRFVFALGEGSAQGAAYDPEKQILTLRSQVRFNVGGQPLPGTSVEPAKGLERSRPGEKTFVEAGSARFVREEGRAVLENSVAISRGSRRIRAARGEIELDSKLRARQAQLSESLLATDETPTEAREARAGSGLVSFDDAGRIRALDLNEDVSWRIEPRQQGRHKEGAAQHVEMFFRETDGLLERVRAERDVRMTFRGDASRTGLADSQTLSGGEAEMFLDPDGRTLRQVRMRSSPRLEILPGRAGADRRTVTGNEFDLALDERGELSRFQAQGKVRVLSEDTGSAARRRETTSDSLDASFNSSGSLERVRQWGQFEYRDPERQARAEQANYALGSETVVLEGKPVVWNSDGKLTATRIELETRESGLKAEGNVSATFFQKSPAGSPPPEPLQVVADRLRYDAAAKRSQFEGHARLWQGEGFLLEANALDWSQQTAELTASGKLYSVFRQPPGRKNGKSSSAAESAENQKDSPVAITAESLVYQQQQGLARYDGGVRMQSLSGFMTSSKLEVFLPAAPSAPSGGLSLGAGEIERVVAEHEVKIVEGARIATGERAEYLPARNEVHLHGQLAKVTDPARGTVEGAELTYYLGDDRIQVQGSPSSPTQTRWQRHP
ncbi:MAG: LPS export ABC transporter periplasmic protein LptC [Acidobacteria bacterium]|nr:LPS export ABC transporter periplasmic protein LptC [Acidobacteriota bacterium]